MTRSKTRRSHRRRRRRQLKRIRSGVLVLAVAAALFFLWSRDRQTDPSGTLEAAQEAVAAGDYRTATVNLKSLLQQNPNQANIRHELGRTYLLAGQAEAALKELEQARELGTRGEAFEQDFVEALIASGDHERALSQLAIHATSSGDARWTVLQSMADLALGRLEQAQQGFREVLRIDPTARKAQIGLAHTEHALGNADGAAEAIAAALATSPGDTALLNFKGQLELERKDFLAAQTTYAAILDHAPQSHQARLGLLRAQIGNHDWSAADTTLGELDPRSEAEPRVLYLRALLHQGRGEPQVALEILKRLLQIAPKHRDSLRMAAILSVESNNHAAAEEYANRLLEIAPGDEATRRFLGALHLAAGRLQPGMKELELNESSIEQQTDANLLMLLGAAYMKNNEIELGQKSLERANALGKDSPALKARLALAKITAGDTERGLVDLEQLARDDPGNSFSETLFVLAALLKKDLGVALERAEKFAQQSPQNPVAINILGFVQEARGNFDAATDAYHRALAYNDLFHPARLNLARVALKNNDQITANSHFLDIIERTPSHEQALLALARLKLLEQNPREAMRLAESAVEQNPSSLRPLLVVSKLRQYFGRYREALEFADKAYELSPSEPAAQLRLVRAGLLANESARGQKALRDLKARFPESIDVAKLELEMLAAQGNHAEAEKKVNDLLLRKPRDPEVNIAAGRLAINRGDTNTAHLIADQITEDLGLAVAGHELRGDAYVVEENWTKAHETYVTAYEAKPSPRLLLKLASTDKQLGNDPGSRFESWLRQRPHDTEIRLTYAALLQERKQTAAAIGQYEKVLEQAPDNAATLNNLAWLYSETGDARAMDSALKAREIAPESPEIMDTYGWMLLKEGRFEQAGIMLQRAAERLPRNLDIKFHLAVLYVKTGQQQSARSLLDDILKPGIEFESRPDAERLLASLGPATN